MSADATVRRAGPTDAHSIARLTEMRRQQYREYQPVFWNPAPDSEAIAALYLEETLDDPQLAAFVVASSANEIVGFIAGKLVGAPPVYNPGGPSLAVDDFIVANADLWATVGVRLLEAAWTQGRDMGATQLVVVCGKADLQKSAFLDSLHLSVASEWWVGQP